MPAGRDRLLRVLAAALALLTIASMVLSVAGVAGPSQPGHRLDTARGWFGLAWFALLTAVLWRSARRIRHMRRLLATREDQIEATSLTSHDWLWEATPELVATACSPAVAEILGRTPEDIIGRPFTDLVLEEDRPRVRAVLADAVEHMRGWDDIELRWLHADGYPVPLQGSAVPILDERRNLIGFRGTRRRAPADVTARHRLAAITARVRSVLDTGAITIALQPIIAVGAGQWAGVEALARFPDQRRPDRWFAEAHEVGLGLDLELLAVRQALATLATLPAHVFISINASPALILDPRLTGLLSDPGLPLQRVILEITEHVAVDRYEDITAVLLPLRERGLRLAIDDTGAGYASFAHVLTLRPDSIKLDRSLISSIDTDPARRAFVTAIVLLALELDATVTAEGIENTNELHAVATLGVDHAQGYLLAKPSSDITRWHAWRHTTWPTPQITTVHLDGPHETSTASAK